MWLIMKQLQAYKLIKKGCFLYQFLAVSLHCESKAKSCFDGYYEVLNTYFFNLKHLSVSLFVWRNGKTTWQQTT